jgi:uncharacterized protein YegP (UPF0339 family)
MGHPRFTIKRSSDAQYYFTLSAANGEIILTSELYRFRSSARNGIASVRDNAPFDEQYERLPAAGNQHYFVLRARNGEIIGMSEMYRSRAGRDNGIESVKRNAPEAPTVTEPGPVNEDAERA